MATTGRPARYHVFLSHAGQQKYEIVGWMHRRFKERLPGVDVFLDEISLQPGAPAPAEMIEACSTASVGIAIISSDFVTKSWPMLELCKMVGRLATDPPNTFTLLPVLYLSPNGSPAHSASERRQRILRGLQNSSLELSDFADFEELIEVYKGDEDAQKRTWGEALGKVTGVTMIRKDPKTFDADIVERILAAAEAHLRTSGAMPENVVVGGGGWYMPPLEVKLVGREEDLKQGLDALLKHRYVEIRGPPGEGKSTLAQHLVQDLVSRWSRQLGNQSIYALQLDVRELLGASVKPKRAVAAALLRLAGQAFTDADWPELLCWIRRPARVVVVFENAEVGLSKEHGDTFLAIIGDLHRHPSVSLVVPTRVEGNPAEVGIFDVRACVVQLRPLTAEQGLELVQAHLGPGHAWDGAAEEKAARELVSLVDGNPLVLSVAAGLVRNSVRSRVRCSWQGILENARANGLDAVAPVDGAGGMRNRMTLLRGWLCDFLEPDQQAFLAALTVFAGTFTAAGAAAVTRRAEAQGILNKLLAALTVFARAFTAAGAAAVTGRTETQEQLNRLLVALLVRQGADSQERPEGQGPRYSMHALVKDAVAGMSVAAGAQRQRRQLQAYFLDWMLLREEGPGRQLLESMPGGRCPDVPLRLHLLGVELLNFAALGVELAGAVGQNPGKLKKLLPNMVRVGRALSENGAGNAARQIHASAADASEHLLGPEHPDTLSSKSNLAATLLHMGERAVVRRLEEEVLEVRTRVLGPEHPDTLTSKHDLAIALLYMGERAEAQRLLEEVLDVRTLVLGPEHPDTVTSKGNLADTLRLMGERAVARRLQEEVLDVRTRVLGPEHPDTVTSKGNLADTLCDMGERAVARRMLEEVLEVYTRVLGPEHPNTVTSKGNLALTLRVMGEWAVAQRLQEEVLEVCTRVLGPEHPHTLTSKSNLAVTLWHMGELAAARRMQEEMLEVRTLVLGPEHPDTLNSKGNLAGTMWYMGERAAARRLQEEVLQVRTRVLGPEHPDTVTSKSNLAGTLHDMGERAAARRLQEEVLEVRTRVLGPEHPDTMTSKNNLALTLSDMGELAAAWRLQEEELEVCRRVLGPEHPDALTSKSNLAVVLRDMRELAAARRLEEEVLEVRTRVLGPEHPDTVTSKGNLALTLSDMGERAAARRLQEEVLDVHTRVLGPEHPNTVTIKSNLAVTLWHMGELAAARRLQEEVLDVCTRVLGPEHPYTLNSKNMLARRLRNMGELAAAQRVQEEVLDVLTRVLGPEHPDTVASKNNLALILSDMGERAVARRLQEEVLEVCTRALGPEHPSTLTSKNNLARTMRNMGEVAKARRLQEELLEVRTRVLGPEHPDTVTSKGNLADTLRDMGELAAARRLEEEVLDPGAAKATRPAQ